MKIENRESKSIKQMSKKIVETNIGDDYDHEDEIELDSERELLRNIHNGFKRVGPQAQFEQFFNCHICSFQFKSKDILDKHVKKHEDSKRQCNKCLKTFNNDNDLDFHITYEHKKTQWNCMQCSFQAENKDNLKNHINFKHTSEKDRKC